ncbi:MAG: sugar phosphate isomerase/epimerase family protein [Anaerotignaceae bacterium]
MKIGTCIPSKYYEKAAEAGYDYVEFAGVEVYGMTQEEFNSIVELKNRVKLPIRGFNAYCNESVPIVGDSFSEKKVEEYAQILCERGEQLGITSVGIGAPKARKLPQGYDLAKADLQAKTFLKITSEIAKSHGQIVLYEAIHKHMCDYCNYTKDTVAMVKDLNDENIKMVLDFYHMDVMGEELTKIDFAMPYVKHLHVSHTGENYARDYITQKDLNWIKDVLTATKEYGYDETISIEADIKNFDEEAVLGLNVIKQAIEEVKKIK